jgi:hypothetical protein
LKLFIDGRADGEYKSNDLNNYYMEANLKKAIQDNCGNLNPIIIKKTGSGSTVGSGTAKINSKIMNKDNRNSIIEKSFICQPNKTC